MLRIKEYVRAESLAQAYELNQKKGSCVLGGMLWLKMGDRNVQTAIDLSGLSLDQIKEEEEEFSIGCMTTLRQLEEHQGLFDFFGSSIRESVRSIVGVQFRNLATVGGSIFGRFGFSDVLTCFLALDSYVELFHRGIVPLSEFAKELPDRDILVRVILKKTDRKSRYLSYRNTRTDFPVLTVALWQEKEAMGAVIGARPGKAEPVSIDRETLLKEGPEETAKRTADKVAFGSNLRAGAEYRKHLAQVLLKRGLTAFCGESKYRD